MAITAVYLVLEVGNKNPAKRNTISAHSVSPAYSANQAGSPSEKRLEHNPSTIVNRISMLYVILFRLICI